MQLTVPVIKVNEEHASIFAEETFEQHQRGGMILSNQLGAHNFRIRQSKAGYKSDWHVAGDATLIIIQQGVLMIELRNGESQQFKSGDMFIAKDALPDNLAFSDQHGHKATVIGEGGLLATHIKLRA